jgi:hypothetical protein
VGEIVTLIVGHVSNVKGWAGHARLVTLIAMTYVTRSP